MATRRDEASSDACTQASSPLGDTAVPRVERGAHTITARHRVQTNSRSIRAMSETVRTRFAPSPTGYLHVGNARTALYSYLYARRHDGRFVVRIEDTDAERNVDQGAEAIVAALRWLGLDWDEGYGRGGPHGPYVQTERLDRYRAATNALVAQGDAYPCYCTTEELEQRRLAAEAHGLPPGYDGHCRRLSAEQVRAYVAEGRRPAIRFRLPEEGETVVEDLIRGTSRFDNAILTDFVIMRANGIPTYMLSAAFDDLDMGITHVIRGEDLFDATPRQVHVFRALGRPVPPHFAHLPLIVGPDRRKLSKRRDRVAVQAFQDEGYLPEAMVNYLALLAWAAPLVAERVTRLDEVPGMVGFLLTDPVELDQAAAAKVLTEDGRGFLVDAAKRLERVEPWTAAAIEETLRGLQEERELKAKTAFQPVRLAVTGRLVSPPLFESMELLGKARALSRL